MRYLEDHQSATIDEAAFVTAAIVALGGTGHHAAYVALTDMAEKATRRKLPHGIAS